MATETTTRVRSHLRVRPGFLVWLFCIFVAMMHVYAYSYKTDLSTTKPNHLRFQLHGRKSILVFLHPRCPCSHATIRELSAALVFRPPAADVNIYFYQPIHASGNWMETALVKSAIRLPHVSVITDHDGSLAATFGVKTSGHVLAYDQSGQLVFSGGITSSRGHEGDNFGRDTLIEFLTLDSASQSRATPVFGCPIAAD